MLAAEGRSCESVGHFLQHSLGDERLRLNSAPSSKQKQMETKAEMEGPRMLLPVRAAQQGQCFIEHGLCSSIVALQVVSQGQVAVCDKRINVFSSKHTAAEGEGVLE